MTGRPAARRARTRITTGAAALLVAFVALGPGVASVGAYTPTPVPNPGRFRPVVRPIAVSDRLVTVVVELRGDPIAVVQAGRRGVPMSSGEQGAIDAALAGAQAPVASRIKALGGRVLASYRAAYNGLKVLIKGRQLAKLGAIPGVVAIHPLQEARRDTLAVPAAIAPAVWAGLAGLNGDGIKVAVIDTGIDYTHANFDGPGTRRRLRRRECHGHPTRRSGAVRAGRAARQGRHRSRRRRLQHRRDVGCLPAHPTPGPEPAGL